MLDGVDESFFERQLDTEDVVLVEAAGAQELLDLILNPARLGGIAGDEKIGGNPRTIVALEFHGVGVS
jgi:hypothetical protein